MNTRNSWDSPLPAAPGSSPQRCSVPSRSRPTGRCHSGGQPAGTLAPRCRAPRAPEQVGEEPLPAARCAGTGSGVGSKRHRIQGQTCAGLHLNTANHTLQIWTQACQNLARSCQHHLYFSTILGGFCSIWARFKSEPRHSSFWLGIQLGGRC